MATSNAPSKQIALSKVGIKPTPPRLALPTPPRPAPAPVPPRMAPRPIPAPPVVPPRMAPRPIPAPPVVPPRMAPRPIPAPPVVPPRPTPQLPYGGPITMPGGPYMPRPDLGPGVGFGPGLPQPGMPTPGMPGGKSMQPGDTPPNTMMPPGYQYNGPPPNDPGFNAPIEGMPTPGMPGGKSSPMPGMQPTPGFKTTWQELGYNSLDEMKAAMDPNMGGAQKELFGNPMPPSMYSQPNFADALGTQSPYLNTVQR